MATEAALRQARSGVAWRVCVVAVLCAVVAAIHLKTAADQRRLIRSYQEAASIQADLDARHVQDALQQIYQTLRIIAGIPGIRAIDRHAETLSASDRSVIARLYDNLYDVVRLSEVYVVPREFDASRIDPATGAPEAPDISFDANVAGAPDDLAENRLPEVETYEYQQLQGDLLPWMAAHYPRLSEIHRLDLPVVASREIVTCDNTEYNRTRRDADRQGVMLTVPFYAPDGSFKGLITASLRNNVLRDLLPRRDAALVVPELGYVVRARDPGQAAASAEDVSQGVADPRVLASYAVVLDLPDPRARWVVWIGHPDAAFYASPEYRRTRSFAVSADIVTAIIAALALVILRERKAFEAKLAQRAFYDALTGLPNRLLLQDRLEQALIRARRSRRSVAVLFLDLDDFKRINDTLGHSVGDALLVAAAERLRGCMRAGDTVSRIGGDEFVVVLGDLHTGGDALRVSEAIVSAFGEPVQLAGHALTITVSVGMAAAEADRIDAATLVGRADAAMYRAKADGKGRCVVFDDSMAEDGLARLELETDLRGALGRGQLRVFYQPIVRLQPERCAELEALVRWEHPARGLVQPGAFIPLAEKTGLIVPIGAWVLEEACRQVAAWQREFPADPPLGISVNLSAIQVRAPGLVDTVAQVLARTGLPAASLKLEITESVVMSDATATIAVLQQLKDLGVRLAVDDFGTGYSSLSYLRRLPVDVLKIDRSFVADLVGDGAGAGDDAIVRSVISLAKSLNLRVTGEGIETSAQSDRLIALGCDFGQGYFYGRPVDAQATAAWLRATRQGARAAVATMA